MRTPDFTAWRLLLRTAAAVAAVAIPAGSFAAESGTVEIAASGCHPVLLLGVVDGDTVQGYVDTSDPSVAVRVKIRIDGIDTPETGGRARCIEERQLAAAGPGRARLIPAA